MLRTLGYRCNGVRRGKPVDVDEQTGVKMLVRKDLGSPRNAAMARRAGFDASSSY